MSSTFPCGKRTTYRLIDDPDSGGKTRKYFPFCEEHGKLAKLEDFVESWDIPVSEGKTMVHVEDLFTAMNKFQNDVRKAFTNVKQIKQAQKEFKEFCDKHNLPVDFTER